MIENVRVLDSKLTAPHGPHTIRRERLLQLMNRARETRLTTVVGGAGYGKTTLVAQAQSGWTVEVSWYRLDESDRDPVTFLCYLVAGVRKHHPAFGTATLRHLSKTRDPSGELQPILTTFLSEIEGTIGKDFIFVLDDFHSVNESADIKEMVGLLLRNLPASVRMILLSRSEPALPLARLRAMRQVTDIGESELAFTPAEIQRLCAVLFEISLDGPIIDAICRKLGGWVSGLILLCHSLRGKHPVEIKKSLLNLKGSQKAIFKYLEENVYAALSREKQDFAIKSSVLDRIDTTFCDRLFNIDFSCDVLRYLEENHLFTARVDDEDRWYCYHQLFREFLQNRLKKEYGRESVVKIHLDAAMLLEEAGEDDQAVRHYISAGEFDRGCRLLKSAGRRMFTEGRFQLLSSYLDEIPESLLCRHPWVEYQEAQLMGLRCEQQKAIEKYGSAFRSFMEREDEEGVQTCLLEQGMIHIQAGNLMTAREKLQQILVRQVFDCRYRIEALGYLMYIASHLNDMAFADRYFEEALSLLNTLGDEDLRRSCLVWIHIYRGYRYLFSGDYSRVLETAEYTRRISPAAEVDRYPVGSCLLVSLASYHLGLYSRGYETAKEGLRMLKEETGRAAGPAFGWGSPRLSPGGVRERAFPDSSPSWLLAYGALNAVELGRTTEAIEDAAESQRRFRKSGCRIGELYAYRVLHRAYVESGNGMAAEQSARAGIKGIEGCTLPMLQPTLKLNLAECLIEKGENEEALQIIEEVENCNGAVGFVAAAHFYRAWLHWLDGRKVEGVDRLLAGLEICKEQGYQTIHERKWIVPILIEAFAQGNMRTYIIQLISTMGPGASAQLVLLKEHGSRAVREAASWVLKELAGNAVPRLEVGMLGKFRVNLNGCEIPAGRWKSRKARTLFHFLVHARPRGYVSKEILMELLWPEEDPGLTVKRFHVAMASLRKTLEPEIVKGVPSSFISRTGDSYRIELGHGGWVDIERFAAELKCTAEETDPDKAVSRLENAAALYHGDFLEEEPYSAWCCEFREKLKKDYLLALKRIILHHEKRGNHLQCIEYAEKYLEADKYAEDICRTLMICYWETGDKFSMARIFKRCGDHNLAELNCGLSEETELLYRELASTHRGRDA